MQDMAARAQQQALRNSRHVQQPRTVTFFGLECFLIPHNLLATRRYGVAIAEVSVVLVIKVKGVHVIVLHPEVLAVSNLRSPFSSLQVHSDDMSAKRLMIG